MFTGSPVAIARFAAMPVRMLIAPSICEAARFSGLGSGSGFESDQSDGYFSFWNAFFAL